MIVHVTRHTEPFAYKERLGYVDSLLSCKVSSFVPELVDWLLLPGMATGADLGGGAPGARAPPFRSSNYIFMLRNRTV